MFFESGWCAIHTAIVPTLRVGTPNPDALRPVTIQQKTIGPEFLFTRRRSVAVVRSDAERRNDMANMRGR
ncbi:hypothetical protein DENIS_2163 [Desulfonema ishimotonii]|uniref:Uncharacterized protein n=1 Tax=Desulfonema ishimotonii TaxID=45657 RepID=A0A401FW82_9BACT|nr:hypothetical protein DENIS_2163 [Desulfonema ishimotonii]